MIENKRFEIIKSNLIIDGARFIKDNENEYTFASTFETATLITYIKALNKLNDDNKQLKKENEQLKKQLSDKEIEWLRDNTVWEQMPTNKSTVIKTTLGDKND